jgi:flagellar protein FliO/FliZ
MKPWVTPNPSCSVIASNAKQSRTQAESTGSGSPRLYEPRDDSVNQRFPGGLTAISVFLSLPAAAFAADAPDAAAAPAISAAGSLLQVFIGLVAVLLLIAATAWVAKRFGVAHGGSTSLLQVVSSASVGTRERVVVVEVGESWLVVGVAPGSVNALMTLPRGELRPATASGPNASFAARLQHLIQQRRDK